MLRFNAHHFVGISSILGQAMMDIHSGRIPQNESMGAIGSNCGLLLKYCEELELPLSTAHLKRFWDSINSHSPLGLDNVERSLVEIQQRVFDELETRKFLALSLDEAKYFEGHVFPDAVLKRFPEVSFDVEEAGKCLALERPTACAFHLMRVTEYGLQYIGKRLGIADERPNWEPIINKIDAELKKSYQDREYKGMADFFANVSAHLNAVKVAWRNRVMHVERKHTPEEAKEIFNATCGLMRYIAENLPVDDGPTISGKIRGFFNKG